MSRKLDAAIAEALGYEVKPAPRRSRYANDYIMYSGGKWRPVPEYSKRGNYMLELDAEMRERGWQLDLSCKNNIVPGVVSFRSAYSKKDKYGWRNYKNAEAETEPLARALAVYKALTGGEWRE